jgi:hypothetical protein
MATQEDIINQLKTTAPQVNMTPAPSSELLMKKQMREMSVACKEHGYTIIAALGNRPLGNGEPTATQPYTYHQQSMVDMRTAAREYLLDFVMPDKKILIISRSDTYDFALAIGAEACEIGREMNHVDGPMRIRWAPVETFATYRPLGTSGRNHPFETARNSYLGLDDNNHYDNARMPIMYGKHSYSSGQDYREVEAFIATNADYTVTAHGPNYDPDWVGAASINFRTQGINPRERMVNLHDKLASTANLVTQQSVDRANNHLVVTSFHDILSEGDETQTSPHVQQKENRYDELYDGEIESEYELSNDIPS